MPARFPLGICLSLLVVAASLAAQEGSARQTPESTKLVVQGFANEHTRVPVRHEDRIVVAFEFRVDAKQLDAVLAPLGATHLETGYRGAFEVLRVKAGTVDAWCAWLSAQPGVLYAEPDPIATTCAEPNDTYFKPYQWNFFDRGMLSNGRVSNFGVNGVMAWNTTQGAGVTVAIVDTGVAYENFGAFAQAPDLAGTTFVSPFNFVANTTHANDDNGHGTHVCGTVRQSTNNALGCAGLASQCRIMPVKVLNSAGSGSFTAIANGITYAADNGANVINLSLGGSVGSTALQNAVNYAWSRGCVVVAATGNSGAGSISYPARYTNCIAVGATRFDGAKSGYSQFGTGIDVVAPGGDTSVDQNGDGFGDGILQQTFSGSPTAFGYYFFQGTSMATPHVAAVAALVKANRPAYTNTQVRNAIQTSCTDLGTAGYDTRFGYGLVNAALALTR